MNIVFACDSGYLPHLETVIKSICTFHSRVNFYVLNEDIATNWFEFMQAQLARFDSQLH